MGLVIFRADANHSIGMGHIMRCLSIADAFKDIGYRVSFIVADDGITNIVHDRGYETVILHSDFSSMEEEIDYWPLIHPDYIIVDSYYVTSKYLQELNKFGKRIVYIDDVYAFPYPVDVLVNYGINCNRDIYQLLYDDSNIKLPYCIIGPEYAPLRSMFQGIEKKVQAKTVRNILVSTGGADELHIALTMVYDLLKRNEDKYTYHFLIGKMNTDKEKIYSLIRDNNPKYVLHESVSDMKSLIYSCDLVVSAAGSTLYEICACGVPFVTYGLADNQIPAAKKFDDMGLGVYIGDLRDPATVNPSDIISGKLKEGVTDLIFSTCCELAKDYDRRVEMGKRMQELIDGYGAKRIVSKIIEE